AHSVMYVPLVKCSELLSSVYRIPVAHIRVRAVLSTTAPTSPYRSAGRPEAMFAIERLVGLPAHRAGLGRVPLPRQRLRRPAPRSGARLVCLRRRGPPPFPAG